MKAIWIFLLCPDLGSPSSWSPCARAQVRHLTEALNNTLCQQLQGARPKICALCMLRLRFRVRHTQSDIAMCENPA